MCHGVPSCNVSRMNWRKVNVGGERYSQIEALAKAERRSIANMVDVLLSRALEIQPYVGQPRPDVGQKEGS